MAIHHLTLADLLTSPAGGPAGDGVAVVDLDAPPDHRPPPAVPTGASRIVIGLTGEDALHEHPGAPACDVVLPARGPLLEQALARIADAPLAAQALVLHMRGTPLPTLEAALEAESAVYSTLQAGPEFLAWRASRPHRDRAEVGEPVRLTRDGGALQITLDRPQVRNALNTSMRDALVDAFALPALDPSITEVHLRGAGESFCAGGDLDEFGSFPDPATAHLLRLQQSVGRAIDKVADRVTAHLHGACAGSGIELPAFARRVVAAPDTSISLPELSLGLIPGAGGTVSLTRRIGRHRTTRLALTGEVLDASTACEWGLVDEIASLGSGA